MFHGAVLAVDSAFHSIPVLLLLGSFSGVTPGQNASPTPVHKRFQTLALLFYYYCNDSYSYSSSYYFSLVEFSDSCWGEVWRTETVEDDQKHGN